MAKKVVEPRPHIVVSGAERGPFLTLEDSHVSMMPEKYGVDFLWSTGEGLAGLQRKEVKDLVSSAEGDRLGRELLQMRSLEWKAICIEGNPQWTTEGYLVKSFGREWTREQWTGLLLSIQRHGCLIVQSSSIQDTVRVLEECVRYTVKSDHKGFSTHPTVVAAFGTVANDRDFGVHVLCGFPGIGVELARRIWDHFGGLPLKISASDEELMKVEGMGKVRIEKMRKAIG